MQGLNLAKQVAAPVATAAGGPLLGALTSTALGALEGGPVGAAQGAIGGGFNAMGMPDNFSNQTMGNRMRMAFGFNPKMDSSMGGTQAQGNLLKMFGY